VAAGEPQEYALVLRFHTLDQHGKAERTAKRDDGLDDDPAIRGAAKRRHEAFVDFQFVERETLQIAEVGIAGTKIIKRHAYTERVKALDALDHLIGFINELAFGNFDKQVGRRHAALPQRSTDHVDDRFVANL